MCYRISFCIFTYNQRHFVKEAIASVLSQTQIPLEIVISDDCSVDGTQEVIEESIKGYNGLHKIIFNKNPDNMGLGAHFSKVCSTIATGDFIIVLGGDDISKKDHVKVAIDEITADDKRVMVDFNGDIIDIKGKELGKYQELDFCKKKFSLDDFLYFKTILSFAPGRIFRRCLISEFDLILNICPTEDSVLVFRSLLFGGFWRVDKSVVYYRVHSNNLTNNLEIWMKKNLGIISQYYADIIKLYSNGMIDTKLCELLYYRIDQENLIRKIRYRVKITKCGKLIKLIKLRCMRIWFKFILYLKMKNNANYI